MLIFAVPDGASSYLVVAFANVGAYNYITRKFLVI